jgi:predicted nucleotidyltransferase
MRDLTREQLLAELLALKPELERKGVLHVALVGSRARRDNRADSDIDLIVDIDETRDLSLLDIISASHIVEDRLGIPTTMITRRSLGPGFEKTTSRDQVILF